MSIATGLRALAPLAARTTQVFKAKAPAIFLGAGICSGIGATVLAVKRTPKVYMAKSEYRRMAKKSEECLTAGKVVLADDSEMDYTQEVFDQDMLSLTLRKHLEVFKAYVPSIALGCVSVLMLLTSHRIMVARNTALTAAIASVSEAFRRYRNNVREEYGDEVDYRIRHNLVSEKVKITETNPETGKTKTMTKVVNKLKEEAPPWSSNYARCFEEGCRNHCRDASTNLATLMSYRDWCNTKLKLQGYLFLNDVYELFGFEPTLAGSQMGWIFYRNEENPHGDNFIDFGFERDPKFMAGDEYNVWLDFNVDDLPIQHRIKWRQQ